MIKKFILPVFIFLSVSFYAQAPQGINYQGVVRDNAGNALSKTMIGLQFKLWQGNPGSGTLVYSEVHNSVATDTFGLYNATIGSASGSGTGTFNAVPWSGGNIWVEVYVDPANGGTFGLPIAAQQLMSVPYALYAQTSGSGGGTGLDSVRGIAHNIPKFNKFGNVLKRSIIYESSDSSAVGIGVASPNADAAFQIANTGVAGGAGKGLLIPRMTLNERSAITNPSHGLIVFQTNNGGITAPEGFWYYDAVSTAWLLIAPAQAVWTLTGNFVGAGNYIGSFNAADVIFKTGSGTLTAFERMRLLNGSGGIQFGDGSVANSYIFPAVRGGAGNVLQLDPSGTNNLIWTPFTGGSSGPWSLNGNIISPTNTVTPDSVGIGPNAATPNAMLDVSSLNGLALQVTTDDTLNAAASIVTSNAINGYPALDVNSFNTKGNAINATANNAFALSGTSNDASALWVVNNSGGSATIEAMNNGTHPVAFFHNAGVAGSGATLYSTTSDPNGNSAKFSGGVGITTDGFQLTTATAAGNILQSDAAGFASWVTPASVFGSPVWTQSGGNIYPSSGGANVGIGTTTPSNLLTVTGGNAGAMVLVTNTSGGDAISASTAGSGSGVFGSNAGTGAGVTGFSNGMGNAGFFQVAVQTNTANALDVTHQGKGTVASFGNSLVANGNPAVKISNVGSGSSLDASTSGSGTVLYANTTGSGSVGNFFINNSTNSSNALNVSTNGTGMAGSFQSTNSASTLPGVLITTMSNPPALKVSGSGNPGGIAASFNGGGVAIGTGTMAPTSGLDVKASVGVSVAKFNTTGSVTIALNDPNVVFIAAVNGTITFLLPNATQCPGRILFFTFDGTLTGGTFSLNPCCAQTINNAATASYNFSSGQGKPGVGIVSDGNNWQILFRN